MFIVKKRNLAFTEVSYSDEDFKFNELNIVEENHENIPEIASDRKETSRLLKEIIDTLSDEQRIVIILFYYQELTIKEISICLKVSENTIKSRLRYARDKIRLKYWH